MTPGASGDGSVVGRVVVGTLRPEHAGEALTVQYAAYLSEGRRYGTTEIPPLVETVDELAADLRRPDVVGLAAACGAVLIAAQLGIDHWFYLYIPWFFPVVLVALLGRYEGPVRRGEEWGEASGSARSSRLAVAASS